jgi:aminoglycoside/choline kinase family phosphotransferase
MKKLLTQARYDKSIFFNALIRYSLTLEFFQLIRPFLVDLSSDSRLAQLHQWIKKQFELTDLTLTVVSGDASFRRYYRFEYQNQTFIAVDAPPDKEDSRPFVSVSQAYSQQGVIVPEVVHANLSLGFMCLSDLGDSLLLGELDEHNVDHYYQKALALLTPIGEVTAIDGVALPVYDEARLYTEMELLTQWLLPHHLNLSLTDEQHQTIKTAFKVLADNAMAQPQMGVHRDFHSRNLMITADDELAVIDYQDAVVGAITYDAVSLLKDCYIQWPEEVVYRHVLAFKQQMTVKFPELGQVSDSRFIRWFDLMGMQRHIKVCGIFARLYYRDGKKGYLKDIPMTLDYLIDAGKKYAEFSAFVALLDAQVRPLLLKKSVKD